MKQTVIQEFSDKQYLLSGKKLTCYLQGDGRETATLILTNKGRLMKTPRSIASILGFTAVLGFSTALMAQGPLAPPGPPAPLFKTLEQVEPRRPISSVPFTINQPGSYYV